MRGEPDGKCVVCGRPGWTQRLPDAPTSFCYCDEHTPSGTIKPLSCLFYVMVLAVVA